MRVRTLLKSRRLTAAAAVAVLVGMAPASAHAHTNQVHQNMTDYAYELLLVASIRGNGAHLPPDVQSHLDQMAKENPSLTTLYADAAKAIPKLRALPSRLTPSVWPLCMHPDFAAANNGSATPDWKLFGTNTLAQTPMGMVRYPINKELATSVMDCGISEDWTPGGLFNAINKGAPGSQLTTRDHTGLVLGYWAQDVDNHLDDWRLRSATGETLQSPAASAGIAVGTSGLIFTTCMIACGLFPPACAACPVAAVVGPTWIIDKIQSTDFGNMKSADFVGFGHFVDVKATAAGATLFDDKPGKFGERAGPNGIPDATEGLVTALFDVAGMHVNHAASDGPKNYEIMLGASGGPGADFHVNTVHRDKNEWEALTIGHTQLTSVANLGMFGWQQFEGQLATGKFPATLPPGTVADRTLAAKHLGEPLHALGDASVPHHAAGTSGWGHEPFEGAMQDVYDEVLGNRNGNVLIAHQVLEKALGRAVAWRNFILSWRAAHPGMSKEVPVRDMITALATNTFNKAMVNQALMFDPNVSLQFKFADEGDAKSHYTTSTMKPMLLDLLVDGIAAELAFMISTTEVMP
jgi:hypothetical protein